MKRICQLLLLLLLGASAALAQTPTAPPALSEVRFLFVVDTSFGMRRGTNATLKTVYDLVATGAFGQMHKGEVYGVWTFNSAFNTNSFPLTRWNADKNFTEAAFVEKYLARTPRQNSANLDPVVKQFVALGRECKDLNVYLITDGHEVLFGTPFDLPISTLFVLYEKRMAESKTPFVVSLIIRDGVIKAWAVDAAGSRINAPVLPRAGDLAQATAPTPTPSAPPKPNGFVIVPPTELKPGVVIPELPNPKPKFEPVKPTTPPANTAVKPQVTTTPPPTQPTIVTPKPVVTQIEIKPETPMPRPAPPPPPKPTEVAVAKTYEVVAEPKPPVKPVETKPLTPSTITPPTPTVTAVELPKPVETKPKPEPSPVQVGMTKPAPVAPAPTTTPPAPAPVQPTPPVQNTKPAVEPEKPKPVVAVVVPKPQSIPAETKKSPAPEAVKKAPVAAQDAMVVPPQSSSGNWGFLLGGLALLGVGVWVFMTFFRGTRAPSYQGSLISRSYDKDKK